LPHGGKGVLTQHHIVHCVSGRKHGHNNVSHPNRVGGLAVCCGAPLRQPRGGRRRAVPDVDGEALVEQALGHPGAHDARPEKTYSWIH